ncbi:hypothetical protein SLEP1_g9556 [Rubroshorea leprosula]|uniref:Uncharacterized protein n=1 Tax=Rubroshorea leprosula TaxID=152421 RepID=A0AAV5I5A5_9ROSI|nr:hypothetical protein SLEP1_g9556 [Rubroshorea leprosula]
MAFHAARYWRSMQASLARKRSVSSTTPRTKLFSSTNDAHHQSKLVIQQFYTMLQKSVGDGATQHFRHSKAGEMAPIWVLWGFVFLAVAVGVHTAKQHLVHSPMVSIIKKRRESIWEVDNPDHVIGNVEKFENKSLLRKLAHIQDEKYAQSDPTLPNFYTRPRKADTLKSVGVDSSNH